MAEYLTFFHIFAKIPMYNIKNHLDLLVERYNTEEFIKDDPVQFPHRYKEKRDIEIVSFLIATIAWGKGA